jgi:hypothetical protein
MRRRFATVSLLLTLHGNCFRFTVYRMLDTREHKRNMKDGCSSKVHVIVLYDKFVCFVVLFLTLSGRFSTLLARVLAS